MNHINRRLLFVVAIVGLCILTSTSYAADPATFKSFYSEPAGWGTLIWASVAAVALGAVVYFSGGLASPLVAGPAAAIGGWLGGTMGLSGVAAVNAGLALLGGGSIAAGGLGMAGGAALITAALDFGVSTAIGYGMDSYDAHYTHQAFVEQSKNMSTLPLPVNLAGSQQYENIMKHIKENFDASKPLTENNNIHVIQSSALDAAQESSINNEWTGQEWKKLQLGTLRALLLFTSAQYEQAKIIASVNIDRARQGNYKSTLPHFLYAVSSMYDDNVILSDATSHFKDSIFGEPDNLLIPLLFSIYLDRVVYRFTSDGKVDESDIRKIALVSTDSALVKSAPATLSMIMVRYFTLIKLRQMEITKLSTTTNTSIKNNPETTKRLESLLKSYKTLLSDAKFFLQRLSDQQIDEKQQKEIEKFPMLLSQYGGDVERLSTLISQARLPAQ